MMTAMQEYGGGPPEFSRCSLAYKLHHVTPKYISTLKSDIVTTKHQRDEILDEG